jgi:choline kinase
MSNRIVSPTDAAVVLVAGRGSRLRPLTDDRPKALVDIGGETILGRAVRLLLAAGVENLVLATGYCEDQVSEFARSIDANVSLCPNPRYETTQNSVSLALCRRHLSNKSFFKLDGDVVFHPDVLDRLATSPAELAVALDFARELDAEAMKARVVDGWIEAFGKGLPVDRASAETIGIERFEAAAGERALAAMEAAIGKGQLDRYYEDYYSELVQAGELRAAAVDVSDLAWAEVDDWADLENAQRVAASFRAGA